MSRYTRLFALLAAVLLAVGICGCGMLRDDTVYAPVSTGNRSSEGFYYDIYENGDAVISGCDITACQITVPERLDGHAVTGIADKAFSGLETAFYIQMGSNIRTVGSSAFADCSSLLRIDLGGGVRSIGDSAFYGCTLLCEVNGLEKLESIGSSAFFQCSSLSCIELPSGLREIGEQAFFGCASLTSVSLPKKGCTLGAGAFSYCDALCRVELGGVTELPDSIFEKCPALTSVVIGDRVTSIGESAFRACTVLGDVTVGKRVAYIGASAFEDTVWLDGSTEEFLIVGDGVLLRYNGSDANVTVPSGVKLVADAFCGNTTLRGVTVGGRVTAIGDHAFSGCSALSRVTVESGVVTVGRYAFAQCGSLAAIYLPSTLSSIDAGAFSSCTTLGTVNYGGSAAAWGRITVASSGNDALKLATVNYSQKP